MTDSQPNPPTSLRKTLRLLLLLAFLFLLLLILLVTLQLTESALNIWRMLDEMSPALLTLYGFGLFAISLLIALVSWWLLKPRRQAKTTKAGADSTPVDRPSLETAIARADSIGVDTSGARREVEELVRRGSEGAHYVVFFGAVSAGKSALIRAITGEQAIDVDPRAGTTRQITHYRFSDGETAELMLTDAPGILDMDRSRALLAQEEAQRADLVVYVCDGELTRDQYAEAQALQRLDRPMILALNKQDRYSDADLTSIMGRLREQLPGITLVPVQAGGEEPLIRVDAAGVEHRILRERIARIGPLMQAIQARLAEEGGVLAQQRDTSLVRLGSEKLAQATSEHRREAAQRLVKQYARKAMVGAMAAVSPGTDILIQGYLGVQMVRALTQLYEVSVQQTDVEQLVSLASQHLGKRLTLLLALTGNVLKAFPGVGTVTGGLMHAVAYGMIFEGLGQAVARTLDEQGGLASRQALNYFEERMSGNLEGRAKYFARLALEEFTAKK
jgi:uncharacterized protein